MVNEVNGELGESVGFANVIFQRTENETNPKHHITIIKYQD